MKKLRACFFILIAALSMRSNAATVELNDGRVYDAEIIAQDKFGLLLNLNGMRVQIPRTMISKLDETESKNADVALKNGEIRVLTPNTGTPLIMGGANPTAPRTVISEQKDAREPINVTREGEECPKMVVKIPLPENQAQLDRLHDAVNGLRATASGDSARFIAGAGPEGLAGLATYGLYNDSPLVRARSAQLLGQLGGRTVLKQLIEAFYAAAHPTIAPYQVQFVETLTTQISALTGQNFHFYVRSGARAPNVAQNMIAWWQQNYASLPPQLGEPELDPTDECYAAELTDLRKLILERREFVGSAMPPDIAPQALPGTPAEAGYLATIPRIPNDLQLERNVPHAQTGFAPKPVELGADRDSPGFRRREDYARRMREYIDIYGRP